MKLYCNNKDGVKRSEMRARKLASLKVKIHDAKYLESAVERIAVVLSRNLVDDRGSFDLTCACNIGTVDRG